MWWHHQLSLKLLFGDIFKMIFHIDFKCDSVNFHNQREQPIKYQHLVIAPVTTNEKLLFVINTYSLTALSLEFLS